MIVVSVGAHQNTGGLEFSEGAIAECIFEVKIFNLDHFIEVKILTLQCECQVCVHNETPISQRNRDV